MRYLVFTFALLFSISATSQKKLDESLNVYFVQWQKGQSVTEISESFLQFDREDVISEAERYTSDTLTDNRFAAYSLINFLGHNVESTLLKKRVLKQLIFGLGNRDGGIIGKNMSYIASYEVKDFDAELKYMLSDLIKKRSQHYQELIKICGWLNITDLIYDFHQMINDKQKTSSQDRWAMRLAMARMGEPDMIEFCLQKAKNASVTDDVVYDLVPDLIYTRQRSMFNYLFQIIESNEKRCSSPNPDSDAKILCAYRVMEQIAPYIEEYPISVDASGDLKSDNYEKALMEVRSWIKQNREAYKIKRVEF